MKKINCNFSGQNNGNSKLSDDQILQLKKDWATGSWTLRSLGDKWGISHGHVYKIVHDKTRQRIQA